MDNSFIFRKRRKQAINKTKKPPVMTNIKELKENIRDQILEDVRLNGSAGLNFIIEKALTDHIDKFIMKILGWDEEK